MLSNNEVTEGLLIAMLGANFVLLFFIAWHVVTACLYFRRVRRLAIALMTEKMDCDELIDGLLPAQDTGGEAPSEKPVATTYLQGQEEPDRVQNSVKGSLRLQRGVKHGDMGYLLTEKH